MLTVREGEAGSLTVGATSPDGSALSYRWLRNGIDYPSAGNAATITWSPSPFQLSYTPRTWQVEVRNAGGAVLSSETTVNHVNREWLDIGTAHPEQAHASLDSPGQLVSVTGPDGRVHIASTHSGHEPSPGNSITFKGHSKDSDGDSWAYASAIPAASPGARISHISLATSWMGEIVATWLETGGAGEDAPRIVRAALYRPGPSNAVAGSWTLIGTVSDTALQAAEPTVVAQGGGNYGIAWLQGSPGAPRDAVLRRYQVPEAGAALASGLLDPVPVAMEALAGSISRLQVLQGGNGFMAFMLVEGGAGAPARWHYSIGAHTLSWSTPADLGLATEAERIHWAEPVNGLTALAATDGANRVYTRRLDFTRPGVFQSDWAYTANAHGSAPVLLIDGEGRIDVFGVSVALDSTHHSVLGHWTYNPGTGAWGSATLLAQSATDFRLGLGLRSPVAGRDAQGNFVLAWLEKPSASVPQSLKAMRYSRFSAGWTSALDVAAPPAGVAGQVAPTLQVYTESGRATIAWGERSASEDADRVKHARLR